MRKNAALVINVDKEQHRRIKDFIMSRGQSITGYFLRLHRAEVERTNNKERK